MIGNIISALELSNAAEVGCTLSHTDCAELLEHINFINERNIVLMIQVEDLIMSASHAKIVVESLEADNKILKEQIVKYKEAFPDSIDITVFAKEWDSPEEDDL